MSSPENGGRGHDWFPAEPDQSTPDSAAGGQAYASPDSAASGQATEDHGDTNPRTPVWRHDDTEEAGRHTTAADFFGRDIGTHAEPSPPPPPQPPQAQPRPAIGDELTTQLTPEQYAEVQQKFGSQPIAARKEAEAESTGAHHLPHQGQSTQGAPPDQLSSQTGTQPLYRDQHGQSTGYAAPQQYYQQQLRQDQASSSQQQNPPGPYPPGDGLGYRGYQGLQVDPRAQEVNNVAAAAGLTQAFRQERHTTVQKPQPQSGWRHAVLVSTFGVVNPGESKIEREDRERRTRVCANVSPPFVFAILSGKGGSGKTTTMAGLGSMFAKCRGGGEVVVLDANPDEGNLASRVNPEARHTFVDVLSDPNIASRSAIRKYAVTSATSQLDVLASSEDLVNPPRYDPNSLTATIRTLSNVYNVIGIDCGNDFRAPLVQRVLDMVTAVVVVTGVQFDSGKAALRVHDYLVNTGRTELVQRSFLMMSEHTPATQNKLRADIEDTVSPIVWKDPIYVPYDPHLYEASVIDLDQLNKITARAYLAGAAKLSDWYGAPPVPLHQQVGAGR